jgi:branched-chain amino acid transport system ATP-binding protein
MLDGPTALRKPRAAWHRRHVCEVSRMTLLIAARLNKSFGGVVAAKDVAFTVQPSELVAIIGPNGAGKSTTFNMIGGQLVPDTGTVTFDGAIISDMTPRAIWRRGIGRTFQVAQTFVSMTVAENVQMALQSFNRESWQLWTMAHALRHDETLALLEAVGMRAAAERPISELAYGDVKRVELAIALASQPKLLLMDEPTAGMAPAERDQMMRLVQRLARDKSIGVLFTEHDMDAVFAYANRILVLVRGEIVAQGTPEQVRADPLVKHVYLGDLGIEAADEALLHGGRSPS